MNSAKIVVTGGSGFIGSKVVATALGRGYEVVSLDTSPGSNPDVDSRICDIRSTDALKQNFPEGALAVIHLAARTSVLESKLDPQGTYETNVAGTHNLLEMARTTGVSNFIFASTNAVVGNSQSDTIDESDQLAPMTPYGATKAAGEMLMSAYQGSYSIAACALRLTNVYGLGMFKKDSIVPRIMRALLRGKPLEIYGDGQQWRDFIYASDVVDAFFLALETNLSGPLTIGAGQSYSVTDIIAAVEAVTSREVPIIWGVPREGEMRGVRVSTARANQAGFGPKVELTDGLRLVWEEFSSQP